MCEVVAVLVGWLLIIGEVDGGIPERVIPSETSELCDLGCPDALVGAIERVVGNDPEVMREVALAWAREHILESHIESLLAIYTESRRNE